MIKFIFICDIYGMYQNVYECAQCGDTNTVVKRMLLPLQFLTLGRNNINQKRARRPLVHLSELRAIVCNHQTGANAMNR
jgi:hypothetical protein